MYDLFFALFSDKKINMHEESPFLLALFPLFPWLLTWEAEARELYTLGMGGTLHWIPPESSGLGRWVEVFRVQSFLVLGWSKNLKGHRFFQVSRQQVLVSCRVSQRKPCF